MTIVALPPLVIAEVLKLTKLPLTTSGAGGAGTNVKPAGNASTMVAPMASSGPRLVTASVRVSGLFTVTGLGVMVWLIAKSVNRAASAVTSVLWVEVLLARTGSVSLAVTTAE